MMKSDDVQSWAIINWLIKVELNCQGNSEDERRIESHDYNIVTNDASNQQLRAKDRKGERE